jgi:aminopeptidase N
MLRGVLGADGFRRSILRYVRDNAGGSVETIDLVRAIEHETGANLRSFFDRWILAPGHPEIEVAYRWDQSRGVAIVTVRQTQASDGESVHGFDISIGFAAKPAAVARNAGDAELPDERRTRLRIERATESFTIPLESEPGLVRIDPGAYLLGSVEYALGTAMNVAILRSESDPIARIRAAKALARDPSRVARETLAGALRDEPFWAVAAEVAAALGETRAPFAHDALLRTTAHPHPKVRRAVAAALGSWRDGAVVDALLGLLDDESYLVAGTALTSLGKTRDRRAFDVLSDHVRVPSWNETIARDALLGLAELADSRVVPILIGAAEVDRPASLRRAALGALARAAELLDQRHPSIGDAVTRALDDDAVSIKAAAIEAAACMGWRDAIPALRRRSRDDDGGLRRAALEAIRRIEEAAHVNAEVANLRREVSELRERLEELRQETEPRKGST